MSDTFSPKGHRRADNSRQKPGDLGRALSLLIEWGREETASEIALKTREADSDTVNDADVSEEKNNEQQE